VRVALCLTDLMYDSALRQATDGRGFVVVPIMRALAAQDCGHETTVPVDFVTWPSGSGVQDQIDWAGGSHGRFGHNRRRQADRSSATAKIAPGNGNRAILRRDVRLLTDGKIALAAAGES
jgi:hypothetical protein